PVLLDAWAGEGAHRKVFTTVMSWVTTKPLVHEGRSYGQKDVEFARFLDLPARVAPTEMELALSAGETRDSPRARLAARGWRLADPDVVCPDLDSYRAYVQGSKAE